MYASLFRWLGILLLVMLPLIAVAGCVENMECYTNGDGVCRVSPEDLSEPGPYPDYAPNGRNIFQALNRQTGRSPGASTPDIDRGSRRTVSSAQIAQLYQGARALYIKGRTETAAQRFQEILREAPWDPLAPNARYWLGECYYDRGRYEEAIDEFDRVIVDYPDSGKAPDALLKIAYSMSMLGEGPGAMTVLSDLLKMYPKSRAAKMVRTGKTNFGRP